MMLDIPSSSLFNFKDSFFGDISAFIQLLDFLRIIEYQERYDQRL